VGANGRPVVDGAGRPVRKIVGWEQPGHTTACWDLKISADGHRWSERFYAADQAQTAKSALEADFLAGLAFDPSSRTFVARPAPAGGDGGVSAPVPDPPVARATGSPAGRHRAATVGPVDRAIILAPGHVRELAGICGQGAFGPMAEAYILLLGVAGGRPGESAAVRTRDLILTPGGTGHVRFSRSGRPPVPAYLLELDDHPGWGPLGGREIAATRTAPLPSGAAARIRHLIDQGGGRGPLFAGWNWETFERDVWTPAKQTMAVAHQTSDDLGEIALDRLRLSDLRHAACAMWLATPGLDVRVAGAWSGHKRLTVFLDLYQGAPSGSQQAAEAVLEAAWGVAGD
jgi:hypothetical protein